MAKSGQRNRKRKPQSGKAAERNRKSAQQENPKAEPSPPAQGQVSAVSSETSADDSTLAGADPIGSVALGRDLQEDREPLSPSIISRESRASDDAHSDHTHTGDTHADDTHTEDATYDTHDDGAPREIERVGVAASADPSPVDYQSLAKAYQDYARSSFEQSRLFVERLAGVRSLDSALELQTDFMKHACETFLTETQKIRDIHRALAKQRMAYLEGVAANMAPLALMRRASGR